MGIRAVVFVCSGILRCRPQAHRSSAKPEVSDTHGNAMTQSAQPNTPQDQKIVSLGIKGIITALCTQSLKYSEIFKLNSVSIKLFSLQNLRYFNKSSKVCILPRPPSWNHSPALNLVGCIGTHCYHRSHCKTLKIRLLCTL